MTKDIKQSKKNNSLLKKHISTKFQQTLQKTMRSRENPVVRASLVWARVSNQLKDVLGPTIFNKWFNSILPIVIADNVLILQTQKEFNVHWINQHYQKLVDILLSVQDKKLSSFFISPSDKGLKSKNEALLGNIKLKEKTKPQV